MPSTKPKLIFDLAVLIGPPLGGLLVFIGDQLLPLGPTDLIVVANPFFLVVVLVFAIYVLGLAPAVVGGVILARLPQRWHTPPVGALVGVLVTLFPLSLLATIGVSVPLVEGFWQSPGLMALTTASGAIAGFCVMALYNRIAKPAHP